MSTFFTMGLIVFSIAGLSISLHNLYNSGAITYKEFIVYTGIILVFITTIFYFKISAIKNKEENNSTDNCKNYYWKNKNTYRDTKNGLWFLG